MKTPSPEIRWTFQPYLAGCGYKPSRPMLDEHSLIKTIGFCPTREAATDQARSHLASRGWLIADNEEFDIMAVDVNGSRLVIKFWMRADKKPVPKFYVKKFDKAVQAFIHENNIKENVSVLLITNTALDEEAFAYHRQFGRFTMKLCFAAGDIKEQITSLHEMQVPQRKNVQTQLLRYVAA